MSFSPVFLDLGGLSLGGFCPCDLKVRSSALYSDAIIHA